MSDKQCQLTEQTVREEKEGESEREEDALMEEGGEIQENHRVEMIKAGKSKHVKDVC